MSLYTRKKNQEGNGHAWGYTWRPGPNLSNLFGLYKSRGDVTVSTPLTLPTLKNGPVHVFRFGALTANALVTASNYCRGMILLCDSLTMGAAGVISMTGKGAAGTKDWINQDIGIPSAATFTGGGRFAQKAYFDYLAANNLFLLDPTLYAVPPAGAPDVAADYANWPAHMTAMIAASGCGLGGDGATDIYYGGAYHTGGGAGAGGAGAQGPGGGGGGGADAYSTNSTAGTAKGGRGGPGRVWGGGCGGGNAATYEYQIPASGSDGDEYTGAGGRGRGKTTWAYIDYYGVGPELQTSPVGANVTPGGTGGILFIIVRGAVNLTAGHILSANGVSSGNRGGSSGAGFVGLYSLAAPTGAPNLVASGGAAGSGSTYSPGPGGAGKGEAKTFAQMGWI